MRSVQIAAVRRPELLPTPNLLGVFMTGELAAGKYELEVFRNRVFGLGALTVGAFLLGALRRGAFAVSDLLLGTIVAGTFILDVHTLAAVLPNCPLVYGLQTLPST